jgi:hypothetical protein
MMRATINKVNAAVRAKLGTDNIGLVKGNGYFYFDGIGLSWYRSSVYTCHLTDLTVEQWVAEAESMSTTRF